MKPFKDLFSAQSKGYQLYRPGYPAELFTYLSSLCSTHSVAVDVASGNGQATLPLAPHFDHVIGIEPSEAQLSQAPAHPKVEFKKGTAEQTGLPPLCCDLLTSAQGYHWFDHGKFALEADRILRPKGILAVWSYSLCEISSGIDAVLERFYNGPIGPYWDPERKWVDTGYRELPLPFTELKAPDFWMTVDWSQEHFLGYVETWSALQKFRKDRNSDPLIQFRRDLDTVWPSGKTLSVRWKVQLRVSRKD